MRKYLVSVVAASLATLLLAGCGAGSKPPENMQLVIEAMSFKPANIEAQMGQPVTITVANKDSQLHDWTIDKIAVSSKKEEGAGQHDMGGMTSMEPELHVPIDAGRTGVIEFTPTQVGTYTFYCTVPGHKDAGMHGTLTVN